MKKLKISKTKLKLLKKREIKKKDKLWAISIKKSYGDCCAYCNQTKSLNAAHIIPREIIQFRWDLDNGLALCPRHHRFRPKESEDKSLFSAHFNPFHVLIWFMINYPDKFKSLYLKWRKYIDG